MSDILVIGNGPSAAKKVLGAEIDAFQGDVCRFNSFRLEDARTGEDYRDRVGSKCNVWVTCDVFPRWRDMFEYKRVYYMSFDMNPEEEKFLRF